MAVLTTRNVAYIADMANKMDTCSFTYLNSMLTNVRDWTIELFLLFLSTI